ncbi:MAG: 16S rRNA (uracil(1498)-N(3))-methyltransferase [Verrucomicrobia bacterium]|nr:16S rRNA (uracil(1498)-N(3))-methyltransferase [Verrucomicrobiota bacterium]
MHRFYLPPAGCQDARVELDQAQAHHARNVLRLQLGEQVVVLDGAGQQCLCEVASLAQRRVLLGVRQRTLAPRPAARLTLLQAVPKHRSLELIIQKATELGVARLVPILSERAVPHWDPEDGARKLARWQAIAIEAVKQSGCPWLPRLEPPLPLEAFLARREPFELPLLATLEPNARHPRLRFETYAARHGGPPRSVAVWVGPEGDFTPAELAAIQTAGAQPISLGSHVLRSETAALYCLAVLSYELQFRWLGAAALAGGTPDQ